LLVLVLAALLALSACGGGSKSSNPLRHSYGSFQFPTVSSSDLGTDPKITSSTDPPTESMLKVLHQGNGTPVSPGAMVVADYRAQAWESSGAQLPPFADTFAGGNLLVQPVDKVVPGWTKKLPGVPLGSRVLLIVPPQDGFGAYPPKGVPILPNDTLMFVIDLLGSFPRDAGPTGTTLTPSHNSGLPTVTGSANPVVTIPKTAPPTALQQQLLVRGEGPKVADGAWIAAQYVGLVWDGRVFDSTWTRKSGATPIAIRLAAPGDLNGEHADGAVPALIKGLVGRTVGSRVLLVVPPDEGYGAAGYPPAGITGKDTLVIVIDILGTYRSGVHS